MLVQLALTVYEAWREQLLRLQFAVIERWDPRRGALQFRTRCHTGWFRR
jgi:hypothetical protein